MPKSKKPRKKYRPRATDEACIRHSSFLSRPFCGDEWDDESREKMQFAFLEPVNALLVGDLKAANWLLTKNAVELAYLLTCDVEEQDSLRRELVGAYKLFAIAADRHLKHQGFLPANIEGVKAALIDALEIVWAYTPEEVNRANETLRLRKYGDKQALRLVREAFPDLDLSQVNFHVVDVP